MIGILIIIGILVIFKDKIQKFQMKRVVGKGDSLEEKAIQSVLLTYIPSMKSGLLYGSGRSLHSSQNDYDLTRGFMDDDYLLQQQQHDLHDPYKTPGVDIVVDESYHGIDHGMGMANPDHHHHGF